MILLSSGPSDQIVRDSTSSRAVHIDLSILRIESSRSICSILNIYIYIYLFNYWKILNGNWMKVHTWLIKWKYNNCSFVLLSEVKTLTRRQDPTRYFGRESEFEKLGHSPLPGPTCMMMDGPPTPNHSLTMINFTLILCYYIVLFDYTFLIITI